MRRAVTLQHGKGRHLHCWLASVALHSTSPRGSKDPASRSHGRRTLPHQYLTIPPVSYPRQLIAPRLMASSPHLWPRAVRSTSCILISVILTLVYIRSSNSLLPRGRHLTTPLSRTPQYHPSRLTSLTSTKHRNDRYSITRRLSTLPSPFSVLPCRQHAVFLVLSAR